MVTNVKIACCTLHNFIHIHSNGEDWIYEEYDLQYENQSFEHEDINEPDDEYSTDGRRREGNRMQQAIANAIWDEYNIRTRRLINRHEHQ